MKNKFVWSEIGREIEEKVKVRVRFDEKLADWTTFNIGGFGKIFVEVNKKEKLIEIVKFCIEKKIPYFILGGGSNVLVSDRGFKGVVVKNRIDKIKTVGYKGKIKGKERISEVLVEVESGVVFNRLVRYLIEEEIEGLEEFLGLPGTVGGGVYGNAHFEEKLVGDFVYRAEILDNDGKLRELGRKELHFSYNESSLSKNNWILIKAVFKLKAGKKNELWKRASEALKKRQMSQPYGDKSAGCIFGNVIDKEGRRISAGYLIDKAGLKGKKRGGAEISKKHGNFIVNLNGANAKDVLELIAEIKREVKKKFGILLKEEIKYIGFNNVRI